VAKARKVRAAGSARNRETADAFAARILPLIRPLLAEGASLRQIAETLNDRRVATARGGTWAAPQVADILRRAA